MCFRGELASFIEELHDSEINGEISWLYDGVYGAEVGDPSNGYAAKGTFASLPEAVKWLREKGDRDGPGDRPKLVDAGRGE
ncbi:MAG TPA: hypothetical protein VGP42_10835 [Stellaceae bacterium]|jgi:hypothetical protein|nr:hypothetical protein [Stellaceae bacterium]